VLGVRPGAQQPLCRDAVATPSRCRNLHKLTSLLVSLLYAQGSWHVQHTVQPALITYKFHKQSKHCWQHTASTYGSLGWDVCLHVAPGRVLTNHQVLGGHSLLEVPLMHPAQQLDPTLQGLHGLHATVLESRGSTVLLLHVQHPGRSHLSLRVLLRVDLGPAWQFVLRRALHVSLQRLVLGPDCCRHLMRPVEPVGLQVNQGARDKPQTQCTDAALAIGTTLHTRSFMSMGTGPW